jgi:uncharacterized membrane protein YbhN (UPF0104 family)
MNKMVKIVESWFNNKIFRNTLKIVLTIAFFVFVNRSISVGDIGYLARKISPGYFLTTIFLFFVNLYIQSSRWQLILREQKFSSNFIIALKTLLWGNFLGFLTPGRVGELFRVYNLDSSRKMDSVLTSLVERLVTAFVVVVCGVVVYILSVYSFGATPIALVTSAVIMFSVIIVAGFAVFSLSHYFKKYPRIQKIIHFSTIFRSACTVQIIGLTIASHLILVCQTMVLLKMFGFTGILNEFLVSVQAYMLMAALPIFIANVGIREFSFSLFIKQFIPEQAEIIAFGVASLVLCINIILPALVGLFWIWIEKKEVRTGISRNQASK